MDQVKGSDPELDIKIAQVVLVMQCQGALWCILCAVSILTYRSKGNVIQGCRIKHNALWKDSKSQVRRYVHVHHSVCIYEPHSAHLVSAALMHRNSCNATSSASVDSCYMGKTKPFVCEHFDSITPQCGARASTVSNCHSVSIYHMPALVCLNTSFKKTH